MTERDRLIPRVCGIRRNKACHSSSLPEVLGIGNVDSYARGRGGRLLRDQLGVKIAVAEMLRI